MKRERLSLIIIVSIIICGAFGFWFIVSISPAKVQHVQNFEETDHSFIPSQSHSMNDDYCESHTFVTYLSYEAAKSELERSLAMDGFSFSGGSDDYSTWVKGRTEYVLYREAKGGQAKPTDRCQYLVVNRTHPNNTISIIKRFLFERSKQSNRKK